jgi:L-alanine-DL-glutamate epimerase-like enolase superfamily enzyme
MNISAIRVYQVDLPLVEGRYSWSEGKFVEVFDSTVVELVTDEGLAGYGEVCPLGPFYLPAFGQGARAGIRELAPTLLGEDPTAIGPINQLMDRALLGHPYVKSAIDMACWDLLGKVTGKSVCDLMGGKFGRSSEGRHRSHACCRGDIDGWRSSRRGCEYGLARGRCDPRC